MSTTSSAPHLRFTWLLDARRDLVFYIGSALVGWFYIAIIWYAIGTLGDPLEDALATLHLGSFTGLRLDEVLLNSLGMMAGVRDPAVLGLGEQIFAAALLGFAMQHYYLDSKIWRVSRDESVRRHLDV